MGQSAFRQDRQEPAAMGAGDACADPGGAPPDRMCGARMGVTVQYKDAMTYIEGCQSVGITPGLDGIRELLLRLGNPQETLQIVHIAGTNGKGSVSELMACALQEAGYPVGRFISPTIREYRERIQISGKMISKADLGRFMGQAAEAAEAMNREGWAHPSPFEIETAVGFLYFHEKFQNRPPGRKPGIVLLEAGMGGLLDATNVIGRPLLSVLTSISRDHMAFLGNSLEEIARQKAGIIKTGGLTVTIRQKPEVMAVLEEEAEKRGAVLEIADPAEAVRKRYGLKKQQFDWGGYQKLEISLAGHYQIDNAVLALRALELLEKEGICVSEPRLRAGFAKARWQGRFQVAGERPYVILDGAHNADGAARLAESLRYHFKKTGKERRIILILGVFRDKEYEAIIRTLCPLAEQVITIQTPGSARALPAYELAQAVREYQPCVTAADSIREALEMAYLLAGEKDVIAACGSLAFQGELAQLLGI